MDFNDELAALIKMNMYLDLIGGAPGGEQLANLFKEMHKRGCPANTISEIIVDIVTGKLKL